MQRKIVLLEFWTYCCINCLPVLPESKAREHKYHEELVATAVHFGKTTNKGQTNSNQAVISRYDIDPTDRVGTLIGKSLFEFCDLEDDMKIRRLQHALVVVYLDDQLCVPNNYNYRIKCIDLATGRLFNTAGTELRGSADGLLKQASFDELSRITVLKSILHVADTNNHLIRRINPIANAVTTLSVK